MLNILYYDDFWNIPLRGIAHCDTQVLAFKARVLDDDALAVGRRGIVAEIVGFECDEELKEWFPEKDTLFRTWRARFDAGFEEKATHPLYVDQRYQELCKKIDEAFLNFAKPVFKAQGVMWVESGRYVFDPI